MSGDDKPSQPCAAFVGDMVCHGCAWPKIDHHWAAFRARRALSRLEVAATAEEKVAILCDLIAETRREALSDAHWASIGL